MYPEIQLICHKDVDLFYDIPHHVPTLVTYNITPKMLKSNHRKVRRDFTSDPCLRGGRSVIDVYTNSGYDKGHLAPAGSFYYSTKVNKETYHHTNIAPQLPHFNRGVWKVLENKIRSYVVNHNKPITVITGAIYSDKDKVLTGTKDGLSIVVPSEFYKIVIIDKVPYSFLFKQDQSDKPLRSYIVSVDDIEKDSYYNFFAGGTLDESTVHKYPF